MLALILAGCLAMPSDKPTVVFETIWDEFDAMYGGFDQRNIDWDAAWDTFHPQVDDNMSDDELFDVLAEMMAITNDGHVKLFAPDREVFNANDVYRQDLIEGTFDLDVVESYLSNVAVSPSREDLWMLRGEAAPDVPYVWFRGVDDEMWVMDTLAEEYPDAKGLIIDLRNGHGGATPYALEGLAILADKDTYVWRSRARDGPEHHDFEPWVEFEVQPREPYWDVPVTVLTDAVSISASERMIMILRELPGTVIIGTPSNGSIATSIGREAPNGWDYFLPVQEVEAADGQSYEGIGLPVDIEMTNDPTDVSAGRDAVYETALASALGELEGGSK